MPVIPFNISVENPAVPAACGIIKKLPAALQIANQKAREAGLGYAGCVSPEDAWKLFVNGQAHLIDIRHADARRLHGQVPNTLHILWPVDSSSTGNQSFLHELENKLPKDAVILLLGSTAACSAAAAIAATIAGYRRVFSVTEGFEGDLDALQSPACVASGWRGRGLPWVQG